MIFPKTGWRNVHLRRYTRLISECSSVLEYHLRRVIKIPLYLPHNNQIRITPKTNSLRRLYRPREAHRSSMYANTCGQGVGNFVGFTSRGVSVLRRTSPPHGGAHAGKITAALWACFGDAVTDCCADPLAAGPAMSRQTILNWREPSAVRRSSLALLASDIVVVVDHQSWPLPRSLNVHHLARQASGGTHAQSHGGKNDRY
jgi:hypothetical protein